MVEAQISIHTPVKGVTQFRRAFDNVRIISIHTPVKGVTDGSTRHRTAHANFNPHTREGCDTPPAARSESGGLFQSTHP